MRLAAFILAGALAASPALLVRAGDQTLNNQAVNNGDIEQLIARELVPELTGPDGIGGAAVAVRMAGRTSFFNYGFADMANRRPVTPDALFNIGSLRKVLEATVLVEAAQRGELRLDDPVAKYVPELQAGGAIREVTLFQLASHTSGLLLPADHPPWPTQGYTLEQFIGLLNAWTPPEGHRPGEAHTYTHAGYVLLQLALERRFGMPIANLLDLRVTMPLGMTATVLRERPLHGERETPLRGAVQGFGEDGVPIGVPGNQQSYYDFPGTGQVFSAARDLATLLAAELGEIPVAPGLQAAMQATRRGTFRISPQITQALAWEVVGETGAPAIVDKPGGINNASAYLGLVPDKKIGIVILVNRGDRVPHKVARNVILPALARF